MILLSLPSGHFVLNLFINEINTLIDGVSRHDKPLFLGLLVTRIIITFFPHKIPLSLSTCLWIDNCTNKAECNTKNVFIWIDLLSESNARFGEVVFEFRALVRRVVLRGLIFPHFLVPHFEVERVLFLLWGIHWI